MQPLARLPLNTKGRPKTPFDGRRKRAKYGSMKEQVGGIYTRNDSFDDKREKSNSLNGSSAAEMMII